MSDGLREQVEKIAEHYGYLEHRTCGDECEHKRTENAAIDLFIGLILERSKAVVIEMIHLSDQIELEDGTPSMEEWKAFKHFRNTMRDRYGITADEVPYKLAHPTGEGGGMIVAFDCDGTLINDRDEPNHRMIDLLRWFADNGDRIYVWSGGGVEYAQRWIDRFALPATAIEKGGTYVDLAIDDEIVELGKINLKIKRFQLPPTKPTGEGVEMSADNILSIHKRRGDDPFFCVYEGSISVPYEQRTLISTHDTLEQAVIAGEQYMRENEVEYGMRIGWIGAADQSSEASLDA